MPNFSWQNVEGLIPIFFIACVNLLVDINLVNLYKNTDFILPFNKKY